MWIFSTLFTYQSRYTVQCPTAETPQAKSKYQKTLCSSLYVFHLLIFITIFLAVLSLPGICGEEKEPKGEDVAWIGGKLIWPGHDLTKASVEVFKDPKFKELYTRGMLLKPEGIYTLRIDDPGTYYIVAFVDDNGNNRFDAGDGMGMYGVMNWADTGQKAMPVRLERGMKLPGIDIQITGLVDDRGRMMPIPASGSGVVTGISGRLIWLGSPTLEKGDEGGFSKAIVFVYSDPSWNNRIAQAKVGKTGEYEISVPAGRYYLLAVIDENDTNLLDVGDKFGIWGMTKSGMFPKAVEVDRGCITKDRNILIIGQMGISGKPMLLQGTVEGMPPPSEAKGQIEEVVPPEEKVILSGNVVWPGRDAGARGRAPASVQAYSDSSMTMATAQAKTDDKGHFRLAVPVGDYFIVAGVDADGDGKYTAGDGIGAYGVANAADEMPKKLTVTRDSQNEQVNLVITAEFDESGQLRPISGYSTLDAGPATQESGIQYPESSTQFTGISGRIVWEGCKIAKATLIFSNEPRFESGIRTPLQLDDDGSYVCLSPPGDYYVMAIVDYNDNDQVDTGDASFLDKKLEQNFAQAFSKGLGRGFYGAGYGGAPQRVTVLEGRTTPFIVVNVTELLGEDGETLPFRPPGSIRFRYGEPDDIVSVSSHSATRDPATQEWWYWDEGVAFTFQETDAGWNLADIYEFNPENIQKKEITEQQPIQKNSHGTLYYTFARNIWAVDASDGRNRRWIAPGTHPTATLDGSKLLFSDTSGNTYLIEPGNNASAQILLGRRKAGLQPAISRDGEAVAFTRDRRIILRNLDTGEESPIPAGAMDLYDPAWASDGELIAYSALPPSSSDGPNRNRDIYYYDLVAGRTERVSTNSLDEFGPAWSPADKRVLTYCRAEGDHAQLWIADFNASGKPVERQLTKYGGRNPAWSPDGDMIIYENNAQLWTIKPDGSDEEPVIVDGEPVFGMDPFWTR